MANNMDPDIKQLIEGLLQQGHKDIKIIIAGDVGTGKSNLVHKIFRRKVTNGPITKIGRALYNGEEYTVTLTDMPGFNNSDNQEKFEYISNALEGCHLVLYCISVCSRMTRRQHTTLNRIGEVTRQALWDKTAFVLTFADQIEGNELEALEEWKQSISKVLPSNSARFVLCGNGEKWDQPIASLGLEAVINYRNRWIKRLVATGAIGIVGIGVILGIAKAIAQATGGSATVTTTHTEVGTGRTVLSTSAGSTLGALIGAAVGILTGGVGAGIGGGVGAMVGGGLGIAAALATAMKTTLTATSRTTAGTTSATATAGNKTVMATAKVSPVPFICASLIAIIAVCYLIYKRYTSRNEP